MKKEIKDAKGITLIALVVTIIVLLILAGVTINAVFGENGLIKQVEIAKEKNTIASYQDEVDRALLAAKTICIAENRNGDILSEAKKELEQSTLFKDATFSEISNGEFTINTKDGYLVTVTENGTTVTSGTGNGKYTVQFSQDINQNDYGCVYSNVIDVIVVKDMGYRDYMDYYLKTKADLTTKERMAYLYYQIENYNDNQALMKVLEQLKNENKTLSQFVEAQYNTTLEELLYTVLKEKDPEIKIIILGLVNMDPQKEKSNIVTEWNKSNSSNQVTTVNEIVTQMYGSETTVEALATEYKCAEGVILDYLSIMRGSFSLMDQEDLNRYDTLKEEYAQIFALSDGVKIKLPDGTEKQENSVSYKATKNGTYEFEVTYNGKTEKYSETVTGVGHKGPENWESNSDGTHDRKCETCGELIEREKCDMNEEDRHYEDNGDGTHSLYQKFICLCGYMYTKTSEPTEHSAGSSRGGEYVDNGDGTHTWNGGYTCEDCGAYVEEKGTPEPHYRNHYSPSGNGTHIIICGDTSHSDGCDTELGNEACTDADGNGHCDFCGEAMLTGE